MTRITSYLTVLPYLLLLLAARNSHAQLERTVIGQFRESPLILKTSLQINCDNDGDKIKILDILYKTVGCQNAESRPKDPAADKNSKYIHECTGKRTCVVPADHVGRPFQPKKPSSCQISNKYQIHVVYACVPQVEIRSMCETFTTTDFMGYLSTPSYPMLLQPGVPVAPCRCHLEAVPPGSRISFILLEYNLVSNLSDVDMNACQSEVDKQYLAVDHDGTHTYLLCGHKYNDALMSSPTLDLTFENPIEREAGALWMQYSAEEANSMVEVSCIEPVITTTAPKVYTAGSTSYVEESRPWFDTDYKLVLGLVAAILFLLIIIAIIVITIRYNSNISHYMMHKYSKRSPNRGGDMKKDVSLSSDGKSTPINKGYQETHFDAVDETTSCGKPTAHIPPQLSINEKLNKASGDEPDPKSQGDSGKYSAFASTYLNNQVSDSDSDRSDSLGSQGSERSIHSPTSSTSSAPSVRRVLPPSSSHQEGPRSASSAEPKFEDIWVRVNTPDGTPCRRVSLGGQSESDRLLMSRPPTVSFNTGSRLTLPGTMPMMHRSEDSRANSDDDEEMDIKFANPGLISPRKTPVLAVRPALKYARHPNGAPSARSDSVTFSDIVHHSSRSPESREMETEQQRKKRLKAAILQYPSMAASRTSPAGMRKFQSSTNTQSNELCDSKLVVDMAGLGRQRKSKSLPNYGRRLNSNPSLKTHSGSTKRPKRKSGSDNDKASSSSQEQLYPLTPQTNKTASLRNGAVTPRPGKQTPNGTLPIGMNRRMRIPENDEELIIRIGSDLDSLMHNGSST